MAAKVTKLNVLLAVGFSCFAAMESASSVSRTETTESATDAATTESSCPAPFCRRSPVTISRCFLAHDPTNCTPPRCVCGFGQCLFQCPPRQCHAGATLYRPPEYCTCPMCVCLPKQCATCDPKNTTIPNFPECECPTCQCIDGQCINNSTTVDSTPESPTSPV